jgi:hypothetical protein
MAEIAEFDANKDSKKVQPFLLNMAHNLSRYRAKAGYRDRRKTQRKARIVDRL